MLGNKSVGNYCLLGLGPDEDIFEAKLQKVFRKKILIDGHNRKKKRVNFGCFPSFVATAKLFRKTVNTFTKYLEIKRGLIRL